MERRALAQTILEGARTARLLDDASAPDGSSTGGGIAGAEIAARCDSLADALAAAGLAPHDPVLVAVSNRAADPIAILAVWRAGGVAVPVHRRAHPEAAAALAAASRARLLLDAEPGLESVWPRGAPVATLAGPPPPARPLLQEAALVTFTSGSTGEPKGVVLSAARTAAKYASIAERLRFKPGARSFVPLQLTFSFGQWVTFLTLMRGGTVRLTERVDAARLAAEDRAAPFDYLAMVPTTIRALLADPAAGTGFTGQLLTGGEALPIAAGRAVKRAWPGVRLSSIYGLTESGTCDFFLDDADFAEAPEGAPEGPDAAAGDPLGLGRVAPDVAFRIDPATGELLIRSPYRMLGYLDRPEATAAVLDADGWLRTGDRARDLGGGRAALAGRLKEMINRAGNKIAPLEVERAFADHPDLAAVLAAGAPDARLGEAIHLLVVPRPGCAPDLPALRAWAAARLPRYKLPDRLHLADALPVGRTGKADRGELRRMVEAGALD